MKEEIHEKHIRLLTKLREMLSRINNQNIEHVQKSMDWANEKIAKLDSTYDEGPIKLNRLDMKEANRIWSEFRIYAE